MMMESCNVTPEMEAEMDSAELGMSFLLAGAAALSGSRKKRFRFTFFLRGFTIMKRSRATPAPQQNMTTSFFTMLM